MYNKLISFSLLLSLLCTTNIIFGMKTNDDNNQISDEHEIHLTSQSEQGKVFTQTIKKDGSLSQHSLIPFAPIPTHTGDLTTLNEQTKYQLSYTSAITQELLSSRIDIPDAIIKTIIDRQFKLLQGYNTLVIQTADQELRVQLNITKPLINALQQKINYKDTATTLTKNNQSSYPWSIWIGGGILGLAAIAAAWFYLFRK